MTSIIQRLKEKVTSPLRQTIHNNVSYHPDVSLLRSRITYLQKLLHDVYPDEFVIDDRTARLIERFVKDHDCENLDVAVSKNDLMFLYGMLFGEDGDFAQGYVNYLQTGWDNMQLLSAIVKDYIGGWDGVGCLLDYASGYGRLTRFLVTEVEPAKIYVSDIKSKANDFQKKKFKVNTLNATYDPESFKPNQKFDMIFVGSLFTHLPQKTFAGWLDKLTSLLDTEGVLIFTVHDMELCPGRSKKENFVYMSSNEDQYFPEVDESIDDTGEYGVTYVTGDELRNIANECGISTEHVTRWEKKLWGQTVYVIEAKR